MNRFLPSLMFAFASGMTLAQDPDPLSKATLSKATLSMAKGRAFAGVFVAEPDEHGTVWVRGERYKLCLSRDGARFQPLFGPRTPRDFRLHVDLASVHVGDTELPLVPGGVWQRDGEGFVRDRGALHEHWRPAGGAAQQFFVVPAPAGGGALELRIAAAGDLDAVDDGPGVRFVAARLGHVHYSDAVVFDAAGARLDVNVEHVAGELVIHVPAAFTANAVWPLLIDPLLTTVAIDTTVSDQRDARVACDPTSGNWLVVAEEWLSATDADIVCHRFSGGGAPQLLETTYAANGGDLTHNPDVGNLAQPQQFAIAWHNATAGNFQVRSRSATSTTMTTTSVVSPGVGNDLANRARVGGALTGSLCLLVLFRKNVTGSDVMVVTRAQSGAIFGSAFLSTLVPPLFANIAPGDVSTLATAADKWVVTWRECTSASCTQQLVRLQGVGTATGVGPPVLDAAITLDTGAFVDEPSIAGHGGNLLAAWRTFSPASFSTDIVGVPIGLVGGAFAALGSIRNFSALEPGVNANLPQSRPAVSYDGTRFVYGYLEDVGGTVLRPRAATVLVAGSTIDWHEGHLSLGGAPTQTIDIGCGATASPGEHVVVFEEDVGSHSDVRGAIVDARVPGTTSIVSQTGCGTPSEPAIALTGTPALGRTFTVSLTTVAPLSLFLVGPENVNLLPGCGACSTGVDLSAMQLFVGSSLAVTVPGNPALIQFRIAFQGLAGGQTGGCGPTLLGLPFALSDTITVQIL